MSDMVGFVAGTYKRGVHLAHISTSLLGLVDAAIGGKTAVNLEVGKNLIGLYKHPLAVVSDPNYLLSLSDEDYACGLAEAVKTAFLSGPDFVHWLEENTGKLQDRDLPTLRELIARCISFKAAVVASDPFEDNNPSQRLSLNYGHTMGHVIETITEHEIAHGVAVAQGMRFEARVAMQLIEAPAELVLRQDALLDALGLPALDPEIMGDDFDAIAEVFYKDKKIANTELRFILLAAAGEPEIVSVSRDVLFDHLRAWLGKPVVAEEGVSK
jgi:3-dehydroquinate synthase